MARVRGLATARVLSAFAEAVRSRTPTPVQVAQAWTGLVLAVLVPVLQVLPVPPGAKFVALLLYVCFGLGSSLVCQLRLGNASSAWAVSLVLGIACYAYGAAVMVWTATWYPRAELIGLSAVMVASSVIALIPTWRRSATGGPAAFGPQRRQRDSTRFTPLAANAASADSTTVLPAVVDAVLDHPAAAPSRGDQTIVMPAVSAAYARRGALTATVRDRDPATNAAIRVVPGAGPSPSASAPRRSPAGWLKVGMATAVGPAGGGSLAVSLVLLICGADLWLYGVSRSSTANVDPYGLLFVLHPAFFAGLAACLVGFVWEMTRRSPRGWVLAGQIGLLLLIMHATVPLLVREPEYGWTYNHLGVIDYIRVHGSVLNNTDIYQQWPTFFATVAQLGSVSGASLLRVAAWAPVFFDAANCLPLFAIARTLSANPRVPWLTVALFTSINWIGQDYLAPQAFAYILCFGVLLILLRWLRRVPDNGRQRSRLWSRLWSVTQSGLAGVPYVSKRTRRIALTLLYFVYLVITASHQISPYFMAAAATGLVVLGLVEGWQIIPMFGIIAATYLLPRYHVVDSYGLFSGFSLFGNAKGNAPALIPTPSELFSHEVVQALALTVWGLTAMILFAGRNRLGPLAVPAVLAFSPMAILLGQSYGGEAIYRVFLFSAPWCAYIIATTVLQIQLRAWLPRLAMAAAATAAMVAAALASMQGEHGQLYFDQFTPQEVQATDYILRNVPAGAILASAMQNLPDHLNARYVDVSVGYTATIKVLPNDVKISRRMDDADLAKIDAYFRGYKNPQCYLVVSDSMERYNTYFALLPVGTVGRLNEQLAKSPDWSLWYSYGDVHVYKFLAGSAN